MDGLSQKRNRTTSPAPSTPDTSISEMGEEALRAKLNDCLEELESTKSTYDAIIIQKDGVIAQLMIDLNEKEEGLKRSEHAKNKALLQNDKLVDMNHTLTTTNGRLASTNEKLIDRHLGN